MSIRTEENKLFSELRRKIPSLSADGVVDEAQFLSARYRIVYVMKEMNGGERRDLREFLFEGGRPQTWDNIARWTEGILAWEKEFPWREMEQDNEKRRWDMLKKIAVVNVKKTFGGHTADGRAVYQAAVDNREILKRQTALYDADFIICCGTERAFADSCYHGRSVDWRMTSRGVQYFLDGKTAVISFVHPEARVRDAYLYYALMDAVREIKGGCRL